MSASSFLAAMRASHGTPVEQGVQATSRSRFAMPGRRRVAAVPTSLAPVVDEEQLILSRLSPGAAQKQLALAVVLVLLVSGILIAGPLSSVRLPRIDAFVPVYVTALFISDSITAILLYAQSSILRSRAILVIASGYLFSTLVLIPWFLTFPGAFGPGSFIGGLQSTSWLYFFQHACFSMFVIGYALLKDADIGEKIRQDCVGAEIALSVVLTVGLVAAGAFFFTADEALLPRVVLDSVRLSPSWPYAAAPVALASVAAVIVLWVRRRSVLDLWLMVVMFLYSVEIPLSYYPNPARFSTGWYAVRVFGFISSSLVLVVLLYEISAIYRRLLHAVLGQRREREARLMTGDAVAASIAHEVRQPLTAMVTTADAGLRFLDRSTPNLDKAKEAFRNITADGHRAGAVVANIRANFRTDVGERTSFDLNEVIREALALGRGDLQQHGILVQADANAQLPKISGNRVQLQQVLVNLIMNAIDAMAAKDEPKILTVRSELDGSDRIRVSVADTGGGIGLQHSDRIFNPLFTTKSGGMGMGLSICRAIIEAHEGQLWFAPNIPRGAVFQFSLHTQNPASSGAD